MKTIKSCLTLLASMFFAVLVHADDHHFESPYITITDETISYELTNESIMPMAGGGWTSSGAAPSITNKGMLYQLHLPVVGSVPSGAAISNVHYKWSLSYVPAGLQVYLCHDTLSSCLNVTTSQTGSSSAFNGLSANKKFILAFQVAGSGQLSPTAFGQPSQVTVVYN